MFKKLSDEELREWVEKQMEKENKMCIRDRTFPFQRVVRIPFLNAL